MGRFIMNGNAVMLNDKFVEYNNAVLSFQVKGVSFPQSFYISGAAFNDSLFEFLSSESNTATIDYGDGNVKSYIFKSNGLTFKPSVPLGDAVTQEAHTYTDGNSEIRTIRISFGKPDKIVSFTDKYCPIYGSFPNEIGTLSELNLIEIATTNLTSFPPSTSLLKNIKTINFQNIGTAISNRIPNEFLTLELERLYLNASVDMSDVNSSNLKALFDSSNKNTLLILTLDGNNLSTLPNNIANCSKLETLIIGGSNPFSTVPSQVNLITSLIVLDVGKYYSTGSFLYNWTSLSNLVNLTKLVSASTQNLETNLPAGLENCIKLKTIDLDGTYRTLLRVNSFINNLYNFININAPKTGLMSLPFRGVTTNCSSYSVTPSGTYQQPSGYVAGSNNGTPASPKEMIWVLVNQYAHTIIYTP
jgi:hypothetical protein